MNEFEKLQSKTTMLAAIFAAGVAELKDEGFLQAGMIKATFESLKETGCLNPKVEVCVSYMGKIMRDNDENEEAADHCE